MRTIFWILFPIGVLTCDHFETVVIGAGPTGLSAAYHLGKDTLLLEQNKTVGGLCRSFEINGFVFDQTGHIMFSTDPYVHELYQILLGENVHWQNREAWIYSKKVFTRYPFQSNFYGLPPEVIKECILGVIEAQTGALKIGDGSSLKDCCADGHLEETICSLQNPSNQSQNYEQFIYQVWGRGIAKHFAIPYNRKLWAFPLDQIEISWLQGRVPLPNLEEIIDGALSPSTKPMGPNARFGYPLKGGFQAMMDGFLPLLKGEVRLGTGVTEVDPKAHHVTLESGERVFYNHLISTIPLPTLIRALKTEIPDEITQACQAFKHTSVRSVLLGIGRENITDKHWIYFPEEEFLFHRIFMQGNASPFCNPPGGFGLLCEISYSDNKPLLFNDQELIERCIGDCKKAGFITDEDLILCGQVVDIPYAYVIYTQERIKALDTIRKWLLQYDIILAGRYSEWEYYNSDHAFLAGKKAAEAAQE